MRYEVKQMPGGGRWYITDTATDLDVCRQWPQHHIMRTWATQRAADRVARQLLDEALAEDVTPATAHIEFYNS